LIKYVAAKANLNIKTNAILSGLNNGGFVFKGELKVESEQSLNVNTGGLINYSAGELVRPSENHYTTTGETIYLDFNVPLEGDTGQFTSRASFMRGSINQQFGKGSTNVPAKQTVRDTISNTMNDDKNNTDAEFNTLGREAFPDLF